MGRLRDRLSRDDGPGHLRRASGFVGRQARGTWRNTKRFAGWVTFDRILPRGFVEQIQYLFEVTPEALGIRGTPQRKQFASAVILLILAILATFLSGGLLIGIALFLVFMVLMSIVRLNPWANQKWRTVVSKLPIKRDYDIVAWERD